MNTLLVFFLVIILISFIGIRYRVPPFMTLVGGAVTFGFAIGGDPDTVFTQVTMGSASVFNSLGIPILAGSVIAKYLVEQGYIQQIVSDIQKVLKNTSSLSGFAGYLIAVPSTCPITAFMILSPVLSHLAPEGKRRSALMYLVALGSTLGVAFVYPTPVTFPLFDNFAPRNLTPLTFDLVAIPLSLIFLGALILYVRRITQEPKNLEPEIVELTLNENGNKAIPELDQSEDEGAVWGLEENGYADQPVQSSPDCDVRIGTCEKRFHPLAWTPFFVIFAAIPIGLFLLHLSHFALVQFIMFAGMIAAVMTALPENRWTGFVSGAKHAGVIIFDICGAGALGYVITQSTFASESLVLLAHTLPLILIPFVLSALIQTAQGSRIVTSILTAQIIAQTGIPGMMNPLALFLMIIAGAGIICFVTDPYFWLLHRTTGDDVKTVFRNYTVPQILFGIVTYLVAFTIQFFWP
jgi:gluconate:H+ symporter, GntP family